MWRYVDLTNNQTMSTEPTLRDEDKPCAPSDLIGDLNEIEQKYAPAKVYTQGDRTIMELGVRVAIVGARKASADGLKRASLAAKVVVQHGGVVASGLAAGVDKAAHESAIATGGRTFAVLGTSLDQCYPRENEKLQRLIGREHLLVTEFAKGVAGAKGNFVRRNRLMALLSHVAIIVEAKDSSGTLSQGWEMLRLGRPLFIMNSVLNDKSLEWPSEMQKYGAMILSSTAELGEWLDTWGVTGRAASF